MNTLDLFKTCKDSSRALSAHCRDSRPPKKLTGLEKLNYHASSEIIRAVLLILA